MNQAVTPTTYVIGFLITTLGLHLIGAVGALLLLEDKHGRWYLQLLGAGMALIGGWLFLK